MKKVRKPNQAKLRFDLEKLRNPGMACKFQVATGRKFASLIGLRDEDKDVNTAITSYNTAVTNSTSEKLGKERRRDSVFLMRAKI